MDNRPPESGKAPEAQVAPEQPPITPAEPQARPSWRDKLAGVLRKTGDAMGVERRVPLEEIDQHALARGIEQSHDDRVLSGFTMRDAMAYLNYIPKLRSSDPYELFPEAYHKTRQVLNELTREGIIEQAQNEDPKAVEQILYRVADPERLIALGKSKR